MIKVDKILFIAVMVLITFGVLMVYSSSNVWAEYKYGDAFKFLKSQVIFFVLGIGLIFILLKINPDLYSKYANKILFVCFILLVLVLIPGIGKVRNGSRSWFGIGPLGVQPSEFAKLGLIIFTAKYLAKNDGNIKSVKKGILPLLSVIISFFLLIMLEPDFGTAMVIILTLVVMIFVAGPDVSFFIKIGLVGLLGMVGLIIVAPYRMQRIVSY